MTAHPLLNVPASILSSFQLRVLFPGESHPWKTGQTPRCDPRSRPNYLRRWPRRPRTSDRGPTIAQRAVACTEEQSGSCRFQPGGQRARRVCGLLTSQPALEHLPVAQARGQGAKEKLLSWLSAKHYMARAPRILTISSLGSQMTSLPADIP